jgi:NADH pyrophosphatase NudC (nudix superfamily)
MEMELIGSILLILAVTLAASLYILRPLFIHKPDETVYADENLEAIDHRRSSLLAERDRILTALHELDFDNTLGKIPAEDYPGQRAALLQRGADTLRQLDAIEHEPGNRESLSLESAEERIAAAAAARRADAPELVGQSAERSIHEEGQGGGRSVRPGDAIEEMVAARRRQREERSAGFCPKCGRPVQKSDQFCSRCGATL